MGNCFHAVSMHSTQLIDSRVYLHYTTVYFVDILYVECIIKVFQSQENVSA
jgi:hypothetical protein